LIYLSRDAIAHAVNRRHTKVEEEDILEAQKKYSQYALDSLLVENSIQLDILEGLLYEFVGAPSVIDSSYVLKAMKNCGIPQDKLESVIDLLCDLTFLGREVEDGRFEFQYNEDEKYKLQVMARKAAEVRPNKAGRFLIGQAFHAYLEIAPVSMDRKVMRN
jgi:hypothetical protein